MNTNILYFSSSNNKKSCIIVLQINMNMHETIMQYRKALLTLGNKNYDINVLDQRT